jgi:hypothetical protein
MACQPSWAEFDVFCTSWLKPDAAPHAEPLTVSQPVMPINAISKNK